MLASDISRIVCELTEQAGIMTIRVNPGGANIRSLASGSINAEIELPDNWDIILRSTSSYDKITLDNICLQSRKTINHIDWVVKDNQNRKQT